ncbi:MAG: 6-carboxytetrahydropterin synthase QueD [Bacteroidales bacterium]|nr:6-carboxytetrahydropterin synthase QueD [Bacteroidales bacterium]
MYYLKKTIEISAAHRLRLDYPSKCAELHGHNWTITVHCRARELDANGMVVDFSLIKSRIVDVLDHRVLNDVLPFNPTAENLARWCCQQVPCCFRVEVQESAGNTAIYEIDEP